MGGLLEKGYAVKVPETQLARQDGRVWYIPHHGVYHPQKKKLCVVFDCASRGITAKQYMAMQRWTEGPPLLKHPKCFWPRNKDSGRLSEDVLSQNTMTQWIS